MPSLPLPSLPIPEGATVSPIEIESSPSEANTDTSIPKKDEASEPFKQLAKLPSKIESLVETKMKEITEYIERNKESNSGLTYEEMEQKVKDAFESQLEPYNSLIKSIRDQLKELEDMFKELNFPLNDPKKEDIEEPEVDWELRISAAIDEYQMIVMTKIMEILSSLVPVELIVNIPILNIDVDIIKYINDPDYRLEIKGKISEKIDEIYDSLPEMFKRNKNTSIESKSGKTQDVMSYVQQTIKDFVQNTSKAAMDAISKYISDYFAALDIGVDIPQIPGAQDIKPILIENISGIMKNSLIEDRTRPVFLNLLYIYEKKCLLPCAGDDLLDPCPKPALSMPFVFNCCSTPNGLSSKDSIVTPDLMMNRFVSYILQYENDYIMNTIKGWFNAILGLLDEVGLETGEIQKYLNMSFKDYMEMLGVPTDNSEIKIKDNSKQVKAEIQGEVYIPNPNLSEFEINIEIDIDFLIMKYFDEENIDDDNKLLISNRIVTLLSNNSFETLLKMIIDEKEYENKFFLQKTIVKSAQTECAKLSQLFSTINEDKLPEYLT